MRKLYCLSRFPYLLHAIATVVITVSSVFPAGAQPVIECGMYHFSSKHGILPVASFPRGKDDAVNDDTMIYIIPTVVHIIHKNGPENIPDAAVFSQIAVLNSDYNDSNTTAPRGKVKYIFCLATKDPQGNPTNGITRTFSDKYADINYDNEMTTKNLSRWPRERYLNIWVVKSIKSDTGKTILGYAYRPQNLAATNNKDIDGVVIDYRFFGKSQPHQTYADYRLGKTTSHEVGHYFNLKHTWGNDGPNQGDCFDDDGIDDTPICYQAFSARYRPNLGHCDKPLQCGNVRQTENFMDYSIDRCLFFFTQGQATEMRRALLAYRASLVGYANTLNTGCGNYYKKYNPNIRQPFSFSPNPTSGVLNFYPDFQVPVNVRAEIYDMLGQSITSFELRGIMSDKISVDLSTLSPATYIMILHLPNNEVRKEKIVIFP